MKIKEIKVSNVLSFGFKQDFDSNPSDIVFGEHLNIIVGANGSGKSNFAEIMFTLFQTYFVEQYNYNYNYEIDKRNNPNFLNKRTDAGTNLRLNKHSDFEDKDSLVWIKIMLGDSDKENLKFIKDNSSQLDEIIKEFVPNFIALSDIPFNDVNIDEIKDVTFKFNINNQNKNAKVEFHLIPNVTDKVQQIVDIYLKNFDLFKKLIEIGISKKKYDWKTFNISFEFLGSHRVASSFPTSIELSPGQESQIGNIIFNKRNQNIKINSDVTSSFGITNAKVGNQIRKESRTSLTLEQAIDKQFTEADTLFFKLNELLKEYLGLSIRHTGVPSINNDSINTEIYRCKNDKKVDFEQLSSGQKSIFTLIFLVITSEIENSFLMIDEPEIHLHPRLQRKYFELLKQFSISLNLQSILITHSPVFIDEKTIKYTYRFFIYDGQTQIIQGDNIDSSEEELIKFLSYTNSAKIFFTNKVILVEGDTDSFFFTYLLNNHIKTNEEVEFLAIGGKGAYKKWFTFLDKFKIKHYLVTDFDFIDDAEYGDRGISQAREKIASTGLTSNQTESAKLTAKESVEKMREKASFVYDGLITKTLSEITEDDLAVLKKGAFIQRQRKIKLSAVTNEIEKDITYKDKVDALISELVAKDIYVLRWGDLEDYLSISAGKKGLQSVVDYCADNKFNTIEPKFKVDLENIFNSILSK